MKEKLSAITLVLAMSALGVAGANAQSPKRNAKPKTMATPPILTGNEIVNGIGQLQTVPAQAEPTPVASPTFRSVTVDELAERIRRMEANSGAAYDEKQKRILLNLDILTRAEQRTESLRKQHFELLEKENSIKGRLEQIEYDIRPEVIERALQIAGSMRPEEIRENRRKSLDAERTNLQTLLVDIQTTKTNVSNSLQRADLMVERLRLKLEKDIEDSFLAEDPPQ